MNILLVNCRIGSLEIEPVFTVSKELVNCRIGRLENERELCYVP